MVEYKHLETILQMLNGGTEENWTLEGELLEITKTLEDETCEELHRNGINSVIDYNLFMGKLEKNLDKTPRGSIQTNFNFNTYNETMILRIDEECFPVLDFIDLDYDSELYDNLVSYILDNDIATINEISEVDEDDDELLDF